MTPRPPAPEPSDAAEPHTPLVPAPARGEDRDAETPAPADPGPDRAAAAGADPGTATATRTRPAPATAPGTDNEDVARTRTGRPRSTKSGSAGPKQCPAPGQDAEEPAAKAAGKPAAKGGAKSRAKGAAKSGTKAGAGTGEAAAKAKPRTRARSTAKTGTAAGAKTSAKSSAKGGATAGTKAGAQPGGKAGAKSPASSPKAPASSRAKTPAKPGRAPAARTRRPAAAAPPASPYAPHPDDRARLLHGHHHDPHGVLGAHPAGGGIVVRALRPYATGVAVVAEGLRVALTDDGDGFFSGLLPVDSVPDYRLEITYPDQEGGGSHTVTTADPYRMLPSLGSFDLHLIGEGRHEELWRALGARPMTHEGATGTRFTVWAPNARGVRIIGDFNFWDGTAYPMRSLGSSGIWELFVPGIGEGALYRFEIARPDGSLTRRSDPMARRTEVPPANASVVADSHHTWGDGAWLARRGQVPVHEAPFSVYEVHLASWRPGLTYRELAEQLPAYVKDLGFTHVELMPVAEHPFGGSWGYQVTGFYAPTSRLGTPDDFKYLVDALHQAGIGVLMDWVPAHFPRDDWALAEFDGRPLYEHPDPRRAAHPDWGTLEFDYGRTEVRNFLVANAVYWCEEFHIDGLRVDAVASMLYLDYSREDGQWSPNEYGGRENHDAVAFLQEMNATVYRRAPGVVTIAEESTAWDGVTRPTHLTGAGGFGGLGFGLKWNMGWMHDSLEYMAKEPVHRKFHHNEMTFSMVYAYSENYVLPISHDEVVHGKQALVSKMPGDWWQRRADHRAYLGFMWAHPGKQLLFMGQEFAQGAEWSEAHGPDWWLLDPAYGAEADHRGVRDLVRDLNTVYGATPALWQRDTDPGGFAWIVSDAAEDNVLAFLRYDHQGAPLLAVSNFSPVVRHGYALGVPDTHTAWREVLNTDGERYGGGGVGNPEPLKPEEPGTHGRPAALRLTLPPLATVWLRPV
ncbi:1,4-alpha-glucan branching enzyme [Streptomyces sp. NPDC058372]|uniref:1,4-alpha-glucan branching enzyme n=1 Tax=Streptomyces sp. NPDC058372 TaxID=3346464 RepID=UPI00364BE4D4